MSAKFTEEEVNTFSRKLEKWSKEITSAERALLILLISSTQQPTNRPEEINTEVAVKSIESAARNALQRFINETKQELANV